MNARKIAKNIRRAAGSQNHWGWVYVKVHVSKDVFPARPSTDLMNEVFGGHSGFDYMKTTEQGVILTSMALHLGPLPFESDEPIDRDEVYEVEDGYDLYGNVDVYEDQPGCGQCSVLNQYVLDESGQYTAIRAEDMDDSCVDAFKQWIALDRWNKQYVYGCAHNQTSDYMVSYFYGIKDHELTEDKDGYVITYRVRPRAAANAAADINRLMRHLKWRVRHGTLTYARLGSATRFR